MPLICSHGAIFTVIFTFRLRRLDARKARKIKYFFTSYLSTRDINTTVSVWPETTIALTQNPDRSLIGGQELVHDFERSLIGAREHLPVRGNRSRNWNLSHQQLLYRLFVVRIN